MSGTPLRLRLCLRALRLHSLPTLLLGLAGVAAAGCDSPHYTSEWGLTPPERTLPAGRDLPPGTDEGFSRSLLQEYAGREPLPVDEADTWEIPFKAKRIAVGLLIAAARDDYDNLDRFFTTGARWGFPDRREFDTFPIFADDGGARFIDVLRHVASRFGARNSFTCPPMIDAASAFIRSGAEPYWCWYMSADNLDILAFKFMVEGGKARIDYVGLYVERPRGPTPIRSEEGDRSPPWGPPAKRAPAISRVPEIRSPAVPPPLLGEGTIPEGQTAAELLEEAAATTARGEPGAAGSAAPTEAAGSGSAAPTEAGGSGSAAPTEATR